MLSIQPGTTQAACERCYHEGICAANPLTLTIDGIKSTWYTNKEISFRRLRFSVISGRIPQYDQMLLGHCSRTLDNESKENKFPSPTNNVE